MKNISCSQALREAMQEELRRDENVIVLGEDIGVMGGPFGLTKGFLAEFGGNRIIETPISEAGFTGMAVGAAMRGMRPVVELMFNDFLGVCMDQIMNQAAKMRYMTGGQVAVAMVLRAPFGAGRRSAGQHSQSLEALFTHIPGLKVACPATPYDAKGLLKSAIRDSDPVIFLEHKLLYAEKGEVPDEEYLIPLGKADIKRKGKDITLITWSRQVAFALAAAEELFREGLDAEVIDLRTLVPLDWDAIAASVRKTHRAIVVHEACKRGGFGGEISAKIMENLFDELDAPVERVAALNIVAPFSPVLEDRFYPNSRDILQGVKKVLGR